MTRRVTPSAFKRVFIGDDDTYATQVPPDDLLHVAGPYGPILQAGSTPTGDYVTLTADIRHIGGIRTDSYVTPEWYGAIGDGNSHPASAALDVDSLAELQVLFPFADSIANEMDWLAWQAALYSGKVVKGTAGARYVINKTLYHPNGRTQVTSDPCDLLFDGMVAETDDGTNLIDDALAGPQNTLLTPAVDWTFAAGTASWVDGALGDPDAHFGQFGYQVLLPQGKWTVEATITLSEGASAGFYGPPYCGFAFYEDEVGQGELVYPDPLAKSVTLSPGNDGVPETIFFDFEIFEEAGRTLWLTFSGGNADITVEDIRIKPFLMNYAVWCSGDTMTHASTAYDFDESVFSGCQLIGPGNRDSGSYTGEAIGGVLHKSFSVESTRCNFRDLLVSNFQTGVTLSDQAYLIRFEGVKVGECGTAVKFQSGALNAGENFRFWGCILFNSDMAVDAEGGGEWFFQGCSWDYCTRFLTTARGAYISTNGHHIEGRHNEANDYLFDITGASYWTMPAGEILLAGSTHEGEDYIGRVESNADQIAFGSVWLYNLTTASGATWTGAGRVTVERHVGPTNPILARLWLVNHASDAFAGMGDFTNDAGTGGMTVSDAMPADDIGLDYYLVAVGTREDRGSYGATGPTITLDTGVARVTDGASMRLDVPSTYGSGQACNLRFFIPVRNGKIVMDRYYLHKPDTMPDVTHGPYVAGTPVSNTISLSTTAGQSTVAIAHDYVDGIAGAGVQPGWTVTLSGVTGNPGGITNATLNATHTITDVTEAGILIDPGVDATSTASGAGGTAITATYTQNNFLVWDRRLWVKVAYRDPDGVPVIVQDQYQGESNYNCNFAAVTWMLANPDGNRWWYTERDVPADTMERVGSGRAPEWATHMMIDLNFWNFLYAISTPPGPPIYLAGFFANVV